MRLFVLADGEEPPADLIRSLHEQCDSFVAADGGADTALRLGFVPDVVIGDMDSFQSRAAFAGKTIVDSSQETNDLEKALHYAVLQQADHVSVAGATGKRLDHTLKNLSVLQQFNSRFRSIAFYDARLFMRIIPDDFSISLPPGHPVSLFPMTGQVQGITTEGLRFSLKNETLENGRRDGSSNETTHGRVRIRYRSGSLLFMTALTKELIRYTNLTD